ncbi:hypothetical protein L1987_55417 [Smallanthus sonchifolius]|uniref:Uncharacterized protein n=1 Tax=Smallanthus sonchifolius TaxID=185202 RepID=A0ACB9EAI7_9ASTR|nr:hypothetical protein L1987_55417 [Smallanthus sonchifolius]
MFIPKPRSNLVSLSYGFGVSTAGEYKVIRICRSTISNEIEVYTLGTRQWRHLGQAPYNLGHLQHGLFLNGKNQDDEVTTSWVDRLISNGGLELQSLRV